MSITASRPNSCRKSSDIWVDKQHRERVVAIHVENRHLDHFRDVCRIHRRARILRQRGETDLIIHDHVHGAAGAVAVELRHVERLRHDALAGKSGVAVNEQRQNFPAQFRVAPDALPGARRSLHHGIDRFQMAGIGGEPDLNLGAVVRVFGPSDNRGDISRRRHRPRGLGM